MKTLEELKNFKSLCYLLVLSDKEKEKYWKDPSYDLAVNAQKEIAFLVQKELARSCDNIKILKRVLENSYNLVGNDESLGSAVRESLAMNDNCSKELLKTLEKDPKYWVSRRAKETLERVYNIKN